MPCSVFWDPEPKLPVTKIRIVTQGKIKFFIIIKVTPFKHHSYQCINSFQKFWGSWSSIIKVPISHRRCIMLLPLYALNFTSRTSTNLPAITCSCALTWATKWYRHHIDVPQLRLPYKPLLAGTFIPNTMNNWIARSASRENLLNKTFSSFSLAGLRTGINNSIMSVRYVFL